MSAGHRAWREHTASRHLRTAAPPADTAAPKPTGSATVTARKLGKRTVDVPDIAPEEHKQRGDATDALFQAMKRRVTEKDRS